MKNTTLFILLSLFIISCGENTREEITERYNGEVMIEKFSYKVENTKWRVYDNDGDQKIIIFESDGYFKYTNVKSSSGNEGNTFGDNKDTWKIIDDNLVLISFTDGYQIREGYLLSNDNYIVGSWFNTGGNEGTWFGIKQNGE